MTITCNAIVFVLSPSCSRRWTRHYSARPARYLLGAVVGQHDRVEDVRVLRLIPQFEQRREGRRRQWQCAPLLLNGKPERFILTVTDSFRLK